MKRKILALSLLGFLAFGIVALGDYVSPGTPPSGNTQAPLFVGPSTQKVVLFEKLGTNSATISDLSNVSYMGRASAWVDSLFVAGTSVFANNVFVGNADEKKDLPFSYSRELLNFDSSSFGGQFDQLDYNFTKKNGTSNIQGYPVISTTIAGIFRSDKFLVSKDAKTFSGSKTANKNYNFEFGTSDIKLQKVQNLETNIGLGNWCALYPIDLGTKDLDTGYRNSSSYNNPNGLGDNRGQGGCPDGSYLIAYQKPRIIANADITSSNNNNNQIVGYCRYFDPVASPKNIGRCFPTKPVPFTYISKDGDCRLAQALYGNNTYAAVDPVCKTGNAPIIYKNDGNATCDNNPSASIYNISAPYTGKCSALLPSGFSKLCKGNLFYARSCTQLMTYHDSTDVTSELRSTQFSNRIKMNEGNSGAKGSLVWNDDPNGDYTDNWINNGGYFQGATNHIGIPESVTLKDLYGQYFYCSVNGCLFP